MSESFNAAGGASNPGLKPLEEIIEPLDLRRLVNRVAEVDLKGFVLFLLHRAVVPPITTINFNGSCVFLIHDIEWKVPRLMNGQGIK